MKRGLLLAALATLMFSFMPTTVYARSGCCSHHGGVCGCGCCDGSSLSTTCAPYYPECYQPVNVAPTQTKAPAVYIPIIQPTNSPSPEPTSTPKPEVKMEFTNTTPTPNGIVANTSSGETSIVGLFTVGILGGIAYLILKKGRKSEKQNKPTIQS